MQTDITLPTTFFDYGITIILLFISAFLSVLDVSVHKSKVLFQDEEYKENSSVSKIALNIERYITSIQIYKYIVFILIVINSYHVLYNNFIPTDIDSTGFVLAFSLWILILLVIVIPFCDIIPKKMSLFKNKPRFVAIIQMITGIITPVYFVIKCINTIVLKIFHSNTREFEEKVSEEEIKALVETASEKGVFNDIEKEMINSIFSFDDITAKDVMVSRKDTFKIDIDEPFEDYLDEILESYYSRIPVYRENIDDIIGILNVKDLTLEARKVGFENVNIESLLQKPYFVPEMKNIDELFKEMQKLRNHMAILVDEYGGFSGIVTIEDLIEQIMGDINDEFDDEEYDIKQISDNVYAMSGTTELREINKELGLCLENENYDTVSALVIEKLGYIPEEGEKPSVTIDNLLFKVELVSDNRIEKLKLIIRQEENSEENDKNK